MWTELFYMGRIILFFLLWPVDSYLERNYRPILEILRVQEFNEDPLNFINKVDNKKEREVRIYFAYFV